MGRDTSKPAARRNGSRGLQEAIRRFGSERALAAAAKVAPNAVAYWRRAGVPAVRCIQLSRLTGIPATRLNPKLYPSRHNRAGGNA